MNCWNHLKEKENFKNWSIRAFNIRNLNLSDEDEKDFKKFKSSLKTLLPNRRLYENRN